MDSHQSRDIWVVIIAPFFTFYTQFLLLQEIGLNFSVFPHVFPKIHNYTFFKIINFTVI